MNEFSKRLRTLMDQRDYTAADVVRLSKRYDSKGISKVNMSQWLSSTYTPNLANIYLLSKIFNVAPDYLMGEKGVSESQKPLSDDVFQMMDLYLRLNDAGKTTALERLEELTQLKKYAVQKVTVLE